MSLSWGLFGRVKGGEGGGGDLVDQGGERGDSFEGVGDHVPDLLRQGCFFGLLSLLLLGSGVIASDFVLCTVGRTGDLISCGGCGSGSEICEGLGSFGSLCLGCHFLEGGWRGRYGREGWGNLSCFAQ